MKPKIKSKAKTSLPQKNNSYLIYLIIIFLVVQVIGLFVASYYSQTNSVKGVLTDDPNDVINALFIIGEILLFTGIVLLLKRFFKSGNYLYIFEFLALFVGLVVVLDILLSYLFALIISFILLVIKRYLKDKKKYKIHLMWYNNFLLGIAIAGAGAIIGLSLGLIPVIVFLILLSIYDIIAVFYTKHMVEIGQTATKNNFAFTVAIPTEKHKFELGNGDLVIPLVVATSILINGPFHNNGIVAGLVLGASFIGLMSSIYSVSIGKKPLPALPPQTALMIIVIIASLLLGA